MTRLEAVAELCKNPGISIRMTKDVLGKICEKPSIYKFSRYGITDEQGLDLPLYHDLTDLSEWEINKELKLMDWETALWHLVNDAKTLLDMRSKVTGKHAKRSSEDITQEEKDGAWTVDGVYV
jgi:hypothetical protein